MNHWVIGLLGVVLIVGCGAPRDGRDAENVAYMQNVVGDVVLQYRTTHGALPSLFSQALAAYPKRLDHRGDAHGRPFFYRKLSSSSFALHCFGRNGKDDSGGGDDLVLLWSESGGWETIDDADEATRRVRTQAIFDRAEKEEIDGITKKNGLPQDSDEK